MKTGKKLLTLLLAAVTAVSVACAFTACGQSEETPTDDTKLSSPANFTFDSETGEYSFDTVENGEFYYIVVSKYDNKGQEFADVAGMTSMIPGTPGQTITGTLEFKEYAYTTNTATPTLTPAELPKAHYVARCIATGTGYTDSDPSSVSFVTGDKLENPKVTYQVADGKLTANVNCYYLEQSLWYNGLPYEIELTVSDKESGEKLGSITFDDWTYNTRWLANMTFSLFTKNTQSIDIAGITSDNIEVTVKAIGDGDTITDSDTVYAWEHEPFTRNVQFGSYNSPVDGWDAESPWNTVVEE